MFEITTYPAADFDVELADGISPEHRQLIAAALQRPAPEPPCEAPWVQLSYDEIPMSFLDEAFSYAEISKTNSPVGLDANLPAIREGHESVLFSVPGLEAHLEALYAGHLNALRAAGEPQRFLAGEYDYPSSTEYLLAGMLACIHFSRT